MLNKFLIGCCYYPEHWDESEMENDLKRIKDLGFNCIRMGEFSWSMYEKEEGKYDFSLLEDAVERASLLGIDVILGTPTAAPPKWLIDKHPEVLAKDFNRNVMNHGARQHHNHTSEVYLEYCARITEEMLKRFSKFKNVIGWQIDNELNCHRKESYAESDDIAFRKWLEKKYGTVENLNQAWGANFWSLDFNDFSEINCPSPHPAYPNPSFMTDYYLFLSDSVINYASVQTKIIRKYMPDAFITHNGLFENIDYRKLTEECLDVLAFDSYPAFQEKVGEGLGRNVAYKLALTRAHSEKFLILEQQSGPGGQLSYLLPTPRPGQIRLWTYQSIGHGATGVLYFRYRTATYGAEQLWYGIYDHDGEENYRSREIRKITEEISRVGDIFLTERQKNDVAIYTDYHNECSSKVESFAKTDVWEIFMNLNRENVHADFITANDDLTKYKVVIFPHIAIADELLAKSIENFTNNGGVAIISARSGVKDFNSHYRKTKAPGVFRALAGASVEWFSSIPSYEEHSVSFYDEIYSIDTYCEALLSEGGESVGKYTSGFLKDKTAICKHGNVYYLGFYSKKSPKIYLDIIKRYIDIKAPIAANLEEIKLGNYTLYLNHSGKEVCLSGYDLLEERAFDTIEGYGVVLKRNDSL